MARFGRQAHELRRRSGAAESVSGGELAQLQQFRSDQPEVHGHVPVSAPPASSGWSRNYGLIEDNATKIHGKHEFQFGFHVRDEWIGKSANSTAGSFDAGTLATSLYDPASTAASPQALPLTGFGLANFELGVLNYNASFQRRWYNFRRQEFDPYFQDNWKVSQRLTLNLGLRYEMRSPLYDKDGTLLSFDFAKHALVTGTERGQLSSSSGDHARDSDGALQRSAAT